MKLHDGIRRVTERVQRTFTRRDRSPEAEIDAEMALGQEPEDSQEETEEWLEEMRKKHGEGE